MPFPFSLSLSFEKSVHCETFSEHGSAFTTSLVITGAIDALCAPRGEKSKTSLRAVLTYRELAAASCCVKKTGYMRGKLIAVIGYDE